MANAIHLSIVLPCYNPPDGWTHVVKQYFYELTNEIDGTAELIIVNDGTPRDLTDEIQSLKKDIPQLIFCEYTTNKGKGYALRQGVNKAIGQFIIYTDIDFPYDIPSIVNVYKLLKEGNDVVVGTKGESYYKHTPFVRKVISKTLRSFISTFLKMPITDTQAGLKGFNHRGKAIFINTTIDKYLFDLEFVYQSFRAKPPLRIVASPSTLRPGIIFRKMNLSILKNEAVNFYKIILRK